MIVMEDNGVKAPSEERLMVYIAALGEPAKEKGYEVLRSLRNMGVKADMDFQNKGLNGQLKAADRMKARFAIIIGDDELKNGLAVIKSMDNKTQEHVKFEDIVSKIR